MWVVGGFCGGGFGFEGVEGFSEGVSDDASCVADGDEFFAVCENGGFKEFGFVFEFEHAELQVEEQSNIRSPYLRTPCTKKKQKKMIWNLRVEVRNHNSVASDIQQLCCLVIVAAQESGNRGVFRRVLALARL